MNASDGKHVLASKRIRKLSLAIMVKDDASPDKQPRGTVFLKAAGREIQLGQSGLYTLVDVPGPVFTVTVGGRRYQEEIITIDSAGLDPVLPLKEIWLKPKGQPPPDTILTGTVVDIADNLPVANTKITVMARTEQTLTGADGTFSLVFKEMATDGKVTLYFNNGSYRLKQATIAFIKETTTVVPVIKLTKK